MHPDFLGWLIEHIVDSALLLAVIGFGWKITKLLMKLDYDLKNFRLHTHDEQEGEPLNEKGIRYPV